MESKPLPYSTFEVKSSALCYGALHNIHHGSTTKLETFPVTPPVPSGTVKYHDLTHNVPALNGTWNVYQLEDLPSQTVVAWFACHIDINPELEIDKILRVSGNPYELYQGDRQNSAKTAEEGVLVINRYDWMGYDKRSMEEIDEIEPDVEPGPFGPSNSVGLVDFEYAPVQIATWKSQITAERAQSGFGCWFNIPSAEYLFGRFGFNEEHTNYVSGIGVSLRKYETTLERFHRKLGEGEKYEGFNATQDDIDFMANLPRIGGKKVIRPEKEDCLGPYEKNDYIFRATDLDVLRQDTNEKLLQNIALTPGNKLRKAHNLPPLPLLDFTIHLREATVGLLNELVLTYLEYQVVPICRSCSAVQEAATKLCPNREKNPSVDRYIYAGLVEVKDEAVPKYNVTEVEARIKSFLQKLLSEGERTLIDDRDFIRGMGHAVFYFIHEILSLAMLWATGFGRDAIVPVDIRAEVGRDDELRDKFWLCKVFWFGYD